MKRRIFSVFFIIYTITMHSTFILIRIVKFWIRSINTRHFFSGKLSTQASTGFILYKKTTEAENKSQYFLLDVEFNDSQEGQLAFDPKNDTNFLLYTPKNVDAPQYIELQNRQSLLNSNFNSSDPVR